MATTADHLSFANRVVVVTGAAQGIGEATAHAFAALGARAAICDRDADGLGQQRKRSTTGCQTLSQVFDVRDADAVERFMGAVVDELGPIDVLVNTSAEGSMLHLSMSRPRVRQSWSPRISERSRTVSGRLTPDSLMGRRSSM